jgi:hypothetical protein
MRIDKRYATLPDVTLPAHAGDACLVGLLGALVPGLARAAGGDDGRTGIVTAAHTIIQASDTWRLDAGSDPFKRPLYLTLTMALPFARPLSTYAMASLVDANGKT